MNKFLQGFKQGYKEGFICSLYMIVFCVPYMSYVNGNYVTATVAILLQYMAVVGLIYQVHKTIRSIEQHMRFYIIVAVGLFALFIAGYYPIGSLFMIYYIVRFHIYKSSIRPVVSTRRHLELLAVLTWGLTIFMYPHIQPTTQTDVIDNETIYIVSKQTCSYCSVSTSSVTSAARVYQLTHPQWLGYKKVRFVELTNSHPIGEELKEKAHLTHSGTLVTFHKDTPTVIQYTRKNEDTEQPQSISRIEAYELIENLVN